MDDPPRWDPRLRAEAGGAGPGVLERPIPRGASQGPPDPPPFREGGDGGDGGRGGGRTPALPGPGGDAARFALVLALIGIGTLFAVLLAAWLLIRRGEDPVRASPLVPPPALWSSTLLLAASSLTLELCARRRRGRWLHASLGLGVGFLASQAFLWTRLVQAHLVPSAGPYAAFLFVLTGLHGLHVVGGLVAMGVAARRLARRELRLESLRLCALYWHFMGAIWVVLFLSLVAAG